MVILLVAEVVSRVCMPTFSDYQAHVNAIPEIAETLDQEGETLLFLGNSLFWWGVDAEMIDDALGDDVQVAKIAPSGSAVLDWHYIVKSHLVDHEQLPDRLVIGFVAHHLDDSERVKYRPLARYFLTPRHFPELAKVDLATGDERGTAALSIISSAIGDQPDIRPVLDDVLAWDGEARTINDLLYEQTRAEAEKGGGTPPSQSFTRLRRLLDQLVDSDVEVTFVAMPKLADWEPEPKLVGIIEEYGHTLIDARHFGTEGEYRFMDDGYHLNETGRAEFSDWLIDQLAR